MYTIRLISAAKQLLIVKHNVLSQFLVNDAGNYATLMFLPYIDKYD